MAKFEDQNRCLMCGRSKDEHRKIIVGLHGAICSECVSLCSDVLSQGFGPSRSEGRRSVDATEKPTSPLSWLVAMTRELAMPEHGQVILGEGNTSAKDGESLWIKASGEQMPSITPMGFVKVLIDRVIKILDQPRPNDEELRVILNAARTDERTTNHPSTETFMHAWLLTLPDVNFVAHTHPLTTLGLMCSPRAEAFAKARLFPDQIVLCGPESVFVPYVAPGFDLALAIRDACKGYTARTQTQPKTILLKNHGLIALGKTANEAVSACLMTEKAAQVFATAKDPNALTKEEVEHIHNWIDEHFRQKKLWGE